MYKSILPALAFLAMLAACTAETAPEVKAAESPAKGPAVPAAVEKMAADVQTIEVACAGCVYKMEGAQGCALAVNVGGKPHMVTGVEFDAMANGLCDGPKQARIAGKVEGGKFVATSVMLTP